MSTTVKTWASLLLVAAPLAWQGAQAQVAGRSDDRSGEEVVKARCAECHQAGVNGAPKIGDRSAWIPRLKYGLDGLVRSAIRGHGNMPARGNMAELTDGEMREAVIYLINGGKPAAAETKSDAMPAKSEANHRSVGGMDVFLGVLPAEALRAYPKQSVEGSMHGGVPSGRGHYHLNVSLFDVESRSAIDNALVEAKVEQPGMSSESKRLEAMVSNNVASYGNYFDMVSHATYRIKLRISRPGAAQPVETQFEYRVQ